MTTAMLSMAKYVSRSDPHTCGASSSGRWRKHPFYMLFPPEK